MKENINLKTKKLIISDDTSLNGVKSDYVNVKNKLIEYKTTIDNFNNQIFINNQSNIIDKGLKLLNINFDEWTIKFEQLIINNFSSYEEKISQYIKDLDNANFEITKLKYKLKEEQDNNPILKLKLDNIKKKLENTQSLLEEKNEMYKTQEEAINLQKKEIENYKKNKEK